MIKAAIIGGTGYTGAELLRLLAQHPQVELVAISSRAEAGRSVTELFPNLRGHYDLVFEDPKDIDFAEMDVVFFATPHGVAQATVPDVLSSGTRIIDLSADFRIRDQALWEQWYGQPHQCPELISDAVYGLPEVNRAEIKDAQLIACPGCYPTSVQLGLLPLLKHEGAVNLNTIVASAASGVTGAGRQASVGTLFSEVSDSFHAYKVEGHRHLPEIEQGLTDLAGEPVELTFVPHLLPVNRGIHTTLYVDLLKDAADDVDYQTLFEAYFEDEPFVDVLPSGQLPTLRSVRGSNMCRIAVQRPLNRNKLVIAVVEDNITKGASGQAVQNMNIMFDLDETMGLESVALAP